MFSNQFIDFNLLMIELISSRVASAKKKESLGLVEQDNIKGLGLRGGTILSARVFPHVLRR